MKNFRVLKTVKSKRIISGFSMKNLGVILLFLLLFPYLVTFLFGNLQEGSAEKSVQVSTEDQLADGQYQIKNQTELGAESIPLEIYVADKLARVAEADWEIEALKAQAVLIRTGLFWQLDQKTGNKEGLKVSEEAIASQDHKMTIEVEDELYGSMPVSDAVYQAVAETAGVCILYQDSPIVGAYFAVSTGATRNSEELGLADYPYLKSVLCSRDFLAEGYSSSIEVEENKFWQIWESISETTVTTAGTEEEGMTYRRDNAGYVLSLKYKGKQVSGESFRQAYGIDSACFHLSKEKGNVIITVKGKGHGLGMSQYGARQLAAEGKTCIEIIEYFFNDVTIAKIE